jgi:hypothetical protein
MGAYGEVIDANGRYWVAVGPNVMNPRREVNSRITIEEMKYGTSIDIKLVDDRTGQIVYVYARVGDVKAHTGSGELKMNNGSYSVNGEGIYQTGISAPDNEYLAKNADASIIEFLGSGSVNDNMTHYRVLELIVYD